MNPHTPGKALALTGGIGCGKSEVGRLLEQSGLAVLDTDQVAHAEIMPHRPAFDEILKEFGSTILAEDGHISRSLLGKVVFDYPEKLQRLNQIVHPHVHRFWRHWLQQQVGEGKTAVVIIPLLFELGLTSGWDAILCVTAEDGLVRERLSRRGWSSEEIRKRLQSQWPIAEKVKGADFIIPNNGTLAELRKTTAEILDQI